jgi:hypothetical protein
MQIWMQDDGNHSCLKEESLCGRFSSAYRMEKKLIKQSPNVSQYLCQFSAVCRSYKGTYKKRAKSVGMWVGSGKVENLRKNHHT